MSSRLIIKLKVELIPEKSWGKSLAQELPRPEWDKLRRLIYRKYNWTCQICGAKYTQVHCHEVWEYDDNNKIQKLKDLECCCPDCHNVHHWGRAILMLHEGRFTQDYINHLRQHFCKINKCSEQDMLEHIVEVGEKHQSRSKYQYKIDLSNLAKIIKGE